MTPAACATPLPAEDLVDYMLGELGQEREQEVEAHLMACGRCSAELESLVRLGARVAALVGAGGTQAAVSGAMVDRAEAQGAVVRQYRLAPGETVACTAGPDDTYVAIRLGVPVDGVAALAIDVAFEDLDGGARQVHRTEDVPVDGLSREVVLLFPGDVVRAYPRSRWTMAAEGRRGDEDVRLGPYTLEHTPWERLERGR
ncbi:MAG: anti-sigma factor [Vicinamibacterales bacterium]